MREHVFLLAPGEPTDAPGLDRIGGAPPALSGPWPTTDEGEPMLHLITVEVREGMPAPEGARLFSVFVKSLEDIDRFDEGDDDPYDVVVRWCGAAGPAPEPPPGAPALRCHALEVRPWLDVERDDERLRLLCRGEPVAEAEADDDALYDALARAVGDEGGANVSYLGGVAVNPAAGPRETSEVAGRFVARFAEHLFARVGRPNFAGGGWLFAFERDAWVEQ